ncbi:putative carbonic anhydrase 5 [Coccinella septempunctata]|uniref:putative carbonic anhydrase 5 n=1 Tax=Coccinella septempunctata TaxID=41139 RepID=UPI001D06E2BD|nr:putative carbonic anhydrase 5 [Coccinella septempunctata]XP_044748511.1 putative carbonic anhydrase 5 [Coccinella septempunctata]
MSHNLIVSLIAIIFASVSHGWNYKEQDKWPGYCQNAIAQSPIDLDERSMIRIDMKPLMFKNWDIEYNATMTNNGHTVLVELINKFPVSVSGGGLPGSYNLVQFHFHWGSEHTIEGNRKALESHFVTYNNRYKSLEEALKYRGGIAVLAVLYEESARQNDKFNPIVRSLQKIKKTKQKTEIKINPTKLLPREFTRFYRYDGSLTTPDCNDVVVWTIFSELVPISKDQVKQFSSIRDAEGKMLSQNFRFIQPLNGRTVFEIYTDDVCC